MHLALKGYKTRRKLRVLNCDSFNAEIESFVVLSLLLLCVHEALICLLGDCYREVEELLRRHSTLDHAISDLERDIQAKRRYHLTTQCLSALPAAEYCVPFFRLTSWSHSLKEKIGQLRGEKLSEEEALIRSSLSQLQEEEDALIGRLDELKDALRTHESLQQNIKDNLHFRAKQRECEELDAELKAMEVDIQELTTASTLRSEIADLERRATEMASEVPATVVPLCRFSVWPLVHSKPMQSLDTLF